MTSARDPRPVGQAELDLQIGDTDGGNRCEFPGCCDLAILVVVGCRVGRLISCARHSHSFLTMNGDLWRSRREVAGN